MAREREKQILAQCEAFSNNGTDQPWDCSPRKKRHLTANVESVQKDILMMTLDVLYGLMSIPPISHSPSKKSISCKPKRLMLYDDSNRIKCGKTDYLLKENNSVKESRASFPNSLYRNLRNTLIESRVQSWTNPCAWRDGTLWMDDPAY